ncbi:MAG: hypothetical protein JNM82_10640, partial [Rhodocyclaceae bacterium]|nr:hypothetical protein [Rhodocyclaceae bacterium]
GYINCPADALRLATETLAERSRRDGGRWAAAWLAGQDAVFANCGDPRPWHERKGPPPLQAVPALPAGAPDWLARDRAYQAAAALFYSGRFDAAREAFLAIGRDARSPWQPLGAYLAARCLLRKASLEAPAPVPGAAPQASFDKAPLEKARGELVALGAAYPPARRLVGWVDARLRPAERRDELGKLLARGRLDAESPQRLADYLFLLDRSSRDAMMAASDPMTAWIGAMQATVEDDFWQEQAEKMAPRRRQAIDLARERWRASRDPLWLLPLLTHAAPGEPDEAELRAAASVPATSPLHPGLHFHLARLALLAGQAAQADAIVDAFLAKHADGHSATTRNRFMGLKLLSADTIEGYLRAAPRQYADPVAGPPGVPVPDEGRPPPPAQSAAGTGLDDDFARTLLRDFPLAALKALAARRDFPAEYRDTLAQVVWTRALVLGDYATADGLADDMARPRATTRHLYERYKAARGPEEKRLAAVLILVNSPEFTPAAISAGGAQTYWGCPQGDYGRRADPLLGLAPRAVSPEMAAAVARERQALQALPVRTAWLAPTLLDWAKAKPKDPEAPKALHFLVAATRMECQALAYGDKPAAKPTHSRDAFRLLHRLWPGSEWAAKTKYYF